MAWISLPYNKGPIKTSKSGIVPPIAPNSNALFPIFFPSTASPQAAPNTICVSESIIYDCKNT